MLSEKAKNYMSQSKQVNEAGVSELWAIFKTLRFIEAYGGSINRYLHQLEATQKAKSEVRTLLMQNLSKRDKK